MGLVISSISAWRYESYKDVQCLPPLPLIFKIGSPPRHLGQFQFYFLRSGRSLRPLSDILHPAPRRMYHLVMGAAAPVNILIAKAHGNVIAELRHLKAFQLTVTAMFRDQVGHDDISLIPALLQR